VAATVQAEEGKSASQGKTPLLAARQITKHYGSVQALRGVDLELYPGEIVGLVGDNGAGKSTLVNILSGALQPSGGTILVDGDEVSLNSSIEARNRGIETVYQDLALAPDLSVWANIFLGRETTRKGFLGWLGWLDRKAMSTDTERSLDRTRIRIGSVQSKAGQLSGGSGSHRCGKGCGLGLESHPHGRADRSTRRRAATARRRADPNGFQGGPPRVARELTTSLRCTVCAIACSCCSRAS